MKDELITRDNKETPSEKADFLPKEASQNNKPQKAGSRNAGKAMHWTYVLLLLGTVFAIAAVFIGKQATASAAQSAIDAFNSVSSQEEAAVYQRFYDNAYEEAERKSHRSDNVKIELGKLTEQKVLEVLSVSDVEYSIRDAEAGDGAITWLEIPGTGVYTVNLEGGEFIVDSARNTVLIRVPKPELSRCTIDQDNVEVLLWKQSGVFNRSYKQGAALAEEQYREGYIAIKKYFASNQSFFHSAEDSAKRIIEYWVRELNPDVPNLQVEIDFMG